MDLEGNYILGVGATYLSKVLKDNVYVTELVSIVLGAIHSQFECPILKTTTLTK